jgi:hypothetical protein
MVANMLLDERWRLLLMRKLIFFRVPVVLLAIFFCSLAVRPASANQTNLQFLLGTSGNELDLTGQGNNTIAVNDRNCNGSTCIFGAGSASGVAGPFSTSGTYLLTSASKTAFMLSANADGTFTVNQTAPVNFTYSSPQGDLTGTLQFLSVAMVPGSSNSATLLGTFTITGGSLASRVGVGTAPVSIHLSIYTALGTLIGNNNVMTGQVEFPSVITPMPEPGTLLLLGTGLAGLCFLVLKRKKAAFATPAAL